MFHSVVQSLEQGLLFYPDGLAGGTDRTYIKSYRHDENGDLASVGADNSINIRWQIDVKELLKYRNIFADPEQFLGLDYPSPTEEILKRDEYGKTFIVPGGVPA